MRQTALTRRAALARAAQAQSFDRVAADYDRLRELSGDGPVDAWLLRQLPAGGARALDLGCGTGRHAVLLAQRFGHVDAIDMSGPMIDVARDRRSRPNVSYRQADLLDVGDVASYDFVLSVMTVHHVPDLHEALTRIRALLAPGGRVALVDVYEVAPAGLVGMARRVLQRVVPLRPRLHALALLVLATSLLRRSLLRRGLPRRGPARGGPAAAWEVYRLMTRREWLDHRVSDRFFTRDELERSAESVFPGYRLGVIGGPRGLGLTWDAPVQ